MAQAIAEMGQVGFGRGAKEVAEKGLILCEAGRGRPSGAKARVDFEAFTARLKSCPVTRRKHFWSKQRFSAACKTRVCFDAFTARDPEGTPVVP